MSRNDFSDSGLGIGGAGRIDPAAEERELLARAGKSPRPTGLRCRRCGQTEAAGAMFTTLGGTNICDDCV